MAENILEVCKVTPSQGSPIDIPLTFFDLLSLKIPPPERLFFYEAPHPEPIFSSLLLPKLKQSLSLTLRHFLPLAGNVTWPSSSRIPVIRYTRNDGVLLTVTRSYCDFHHLSCNEIRECKNFRPLVAHIVGSDSQVPTFALKVTLFPNKGFCIGITVHHGVFDARSVALFMKSWASISKLGEIKGWSSKLTPIFDRKSIKKQYSKNEYSYIEFLKQNGIKHNSLSINESEPLPDRVRGTFKMSRSDVKKLKELVLARLAKYKNEDSNLTPIISTLVVTYAYVIICLVKAKRVTKNKVCVGFPIDLRGRLEPPLPGNYFGNCIGPYTIEFDKEELLKRDAVTVIVNSISRIINNKDDGHFKGEEQRLPHVFSGLADDSRTINVFIGGSSGLGFQRLDFGWGMPRKVDITFVDKLYAVSFEEGDGGAAVELSLNKHEMERFSFGFIQGLDKLIKHGLAAL